MCFHSAGDLHRCQYKTTRRMDHEINGHIIRRFLDRRYDGLSALQIDVPGDGKAENAAPFLTMDHRDDTGPVRFLNCADSLCASHAMPSPGEQGLQHHDQEKNPDERREIERHDYSSSRFMLSASSCFSYCKNCRVRLDIGNIRNSAGKDRAARG